MGFSVERLHMLLCYLLLPERFVLYWLVSASYYLSLKAGEAASGHLERRRSLRFSRAFTYKPTWEYMIC
jgi:hypothetical protein